MNNEWSNLKFLIVEDTESSFLYYKSVLKKTGATVFLATNGLQAVETIKDNPDIDIILMDIHMPKMSGLEAASLIKTINPNISIIAQTAYVLNYTEEESIDAGCDVFLKKPISLITLISTINDLIQKK